jgi:hypothetical protein
MNFHFMGTTFGVVSPGGVGMSSNPEGVRERGPGVTGTMEVDETVVAEDECLPVAADNE